MKNLPRVSKRLLGLIVGAAFVFTAFFGVHLTMQQDDMSGQMQNCPFMADTKSICAMSLTEHIKAWQRLFTFTPQRQKLLLALFPMASLLFAAFALQFNFALFKRSFQFVRNKSGPPVAFSNGVSPKRE